MDVARIHILQFSTTQLENAALAWTKIRMATFMGMRFKLKNIQLCLWVCKSIIMKQRPWRSTSHFLRLFSVILHFLYVFFLFLFLSSFFHFLLRVDFLSRGGLTCELKASTQQSWNRSGGLWHDNSPTCKHQGRQADFHSVASAFEKGQEVRKGVKITAPSWQHRTFNREKRKIWLKHT